MIKPKFAINKISFKIKTENNGIKDISRNNNNLNIYSLFTENSSEIISNRLSTKINKYKKLDLSYSWKKPPEKENNHN